MSNPYASPPSGGRTGGTPDGTGGAPGGPDGSTPGGASPLPPASPRPPRPEPDPVRLAAANRMVLHFGVFMLATWVAMQLPLPWQAGAVAFAVGALVAGIRALRAAMAAGARGMLVPVLSAGVFFAGFLLLVTLVTLVAWPVRAEYEECLRDALTIAAEEECEARLQEQLTSWGDPAGTLTTP